MTQPSLVWLRQDLRLYDQPAFAAAAGEGPVIPVYILDDETPGRWKIGGAQRWWLHHSLADLKERLERSGSGLVLRRGEAVRELIRLASKTGARRVHATRHYEPWWRDAERRLAGELDLVLHDGNVLVPPEQVRTGAGTPYKIYTPYWRALQEQLPPTSPLPPPERLAAPGQWPSSEDLSSWALLPNRPIGPRLSARRGGRARRPRCAGSASSAPRRGNMPGGATCRARKAPAASRRTSTSASFRRGWSGTACRTPPRRSFGRSSPGATSRTT